MSSLNKTWFHSLSFKGTIALVIVAVVLLIGALWIVNTTGKQKVLEESSRVIEETGNNIVEGLVTRSKEIASLVRGIAILTESLPNEESAYLKTFPPLFDFNGDKRVAGGGIWPEPHWFEKDVERRSFFWGRNKNGLFEYFDDYNNPAGKGYHNEEWYVVVRHAGPGRCFWSKSYMDPYSFQPMVTCTVGTFDGGKFTGAVTVDLKLEGIEATLEEWQKKTGGYIALVDRNGKFIAFPEAGGKAKNISKDSNGKKLESFMTVDEFAEKEPLFKPINDAVLRMNHFILREAKNVSGFQSERSIAINADSYQINREEAEFISAVLVDPLKGKKGKTNLFDSFEIENDFLLQEKSIVFLFHIPESYWKLVVIKPLSEATSVATSLVESLVVKLGTLIILLTALGYFIMRHFLVRPLSKITKTIQDVDASIAAGHIKSLKNKPLGKYSKDEIGKLSNFFDRLSRDFAQAQETIDNQKNTLEIKVEERTKELVRSKLKAESADRAKSTFISSMSHEIRTPMNAILGYSQILERDKSLNAKQAKGIESIYRAGKHLLGIINDILDFSKIEAGKLELHPHDFDLGSLVQDLMVIFSGKCREQDLELRAQGIHEGQNVYVHADSSKLRQVLINLIGNAVKFTESGCVSFRVMPVADNQFYFEVKDTGQGIPSENLGSIFIAFKQDEEGIKKGGTGLGLAISKNIVSAMGGELEVESEMGKGTRFFFSLNLPSSKSDVKSKDDRLKHAIGLAQGHSVKAVLIDDIRDNLDVLAGTLQELGVETTEAESGLEGLEKVQEVMPDIIFLDYHMPGMDGLEVTRRVQNKYGNEKIKIVMVSASTFAHHREQYMKEGLHGFVGKPFMREEILGVMARLLNIEYKYEDDDSSPKVKLAEDINYSSIKLPMVLRIYKEDGVRRNVGGVGRIPARR
jgi:signal transduction histidine kinase/CheY-like chemotaxis protein